MSDATRDPPIRPSEKRKLLRFVWMHLIEIGFAVLSIGIAFGFDGFSKYLRLQELPPSNILMGVVLSFEALSALSGVLLGLHLTVMFIVEVWGDTIRSLVEWWKKRHNGTKKD